MSEQNPFDELENISNEPSSVEQERLDRIQRDVEGSYNMSRDIFSAISTLTDKIFTVFSGFIGFFDEQEERFIHSNFPKNEDDAEQRDSE